MGASAQYRAQTADVRQILLAMGMGQFNATMVIPYMFIPPATTDGDMAQIQMLVQLIQRRINSLGGSVDVTGRLDAPTVAALERAFGPEWVRTSWYELCRMLIARTDILSRASYPSRGRAQAIGGPKTMDGLSFLPDVPTELVLLGAGLIAWHFYKKRKG